MTYAALVWWPNREKRATVTRLRKIHKHTYDVITEAMRTTSAIIGLTQLHLVKQSEARLTAYRLKTLCEIILD